MLNLKLIDNIFRNRKGNLIGKYKKSAVMILLYEKDGKDHIIYEQRAFTLNHQPGDICFPGGKMEGDESPKETAIREVVEELGVKEEDIEFLGEMDFFISPYGAIMYPFVARLHTSDINPNKDEVDHIFMVPLDYFENNPPEVHEININPEIKDDFPFHMIYGGREYKFARGKMVQYFYSYDNHNIWGFTALITKTFCDIVKSAVNR